MTTGRSGYGYRDQLVANAEVYGSDSEKIGHLVEAGTNYFLVQKGFFFIEDLYLPMSSITRVEADRVYLSYTKAQAEQMGREQLPTEGDAWYGNTGTGAATTGTGHATSRTTGPGTDREMRKGENISVPVVEEELKAGVREREAGTARIVKDVREEQQTLDVPVQHEEVYVTERRVDRPATQADLAMREREIEIPLKQQEVVTQKEARVVGEVEVRKEVKRETERVTDTVRREEVHVEDAGSKHVHVEGERGARRQADTSGGKTVTDKRKYDAQGKLVDEKVTEKPNRS